MLRPALRLRPRRPSPLPRCFLRHVSDSPLIHIQNGTFYRHYPTPDDQSKGLNQPLFSNLNFALPSETTNPQCWAVVGGSGRSSLLDVLRGQLICLPPEARSYPHLLSDEIAQKDPRLRFVGNAIQYIGFAGEGSSAIGGTRGAYLSARYESLREETDWTVRQFLKGETSLNPAEEQKYETERDRNLFSQTVSDLRLQELLDMPVANLSNGQTRRARIAKALLNKPELLLLDEPFMGLDPATVRGLSNLLHQMAQNSAPRMILGLRPQDDIPDWVTHVLILGIANEVLFQDTKANVERELYIWSNLAANRRKHFEQVKDNILRGTNRVVKLDRELLVNLKVRPPRTETIRIPGSAGGEPLIEMDGVRVRYGDTSALGNWQQQVDNEEKDGLHWTVRRGQRWAILGPNGSGKTTLLSLITSDHPQAYALPIRLFGRSRLPEAGKPGLSIFDLQSRMGHSSPEIHAFFPRQLSIRQALESAFADTFLSKPNLTFERDLDVSAALRFFKAELDPNANASAEEPTTEPDPPSPLPRLHRPRKPLDITTDEDIDYADDIRFGELTTDQQRVVLFLRALIHKPDLVILDEPFSGFPVTLRDKCIHFLEAGELSRQNSTTVSRRTNFLDKWVTTVDSYKPPSAAVRHRGLSDDQALIVISHVKEEIPDIVRHFMRLPGNPGGETKPLDFRLGTLNPTRAISDDQTWEALWTQSKKFTKYSGASRHPDDERYRWDYL